MALVVLVLLLVGAAVAYPWLGVAAVVVLVVWVTAATVAGRSRRAQPAVVPRVSLERRVALRQARRELSDIEAGAALPPTEV